MADQYLQQLAEEIAPAYTDLLPITDNGTQRLRKVPVSTLFVEYNVKHYGAEGNGISNDQSAIQSAIDAANAAGGGCVIFPKGTYKLGTGGGITLYSKLQLVFHPGSIIDGTSLANSSKVFSAAGTETGSVNLSANATKGSSSLTVSAGSEAGFATGDYVKIGSTARWTPNSTLDSSMDQRIGEIGIVSSTSSGQITLRWPLVDTYNTSDTAFVAKVSILDNVGLMGPGKILGKGTGTSSIGVHLDRVQKAVIDGVAFYDFDAKAIELYDCIDASITHVAVIGGASAASTFYGVSFNFACQDCTVTKSYFRDVRHGVTLGGSTARSGINRRITISECHAQDTTASSFDSHAGAEDVTVASCTSIDSVDSGVSLRNPAAVVVGNTIVRPGGHGIYLRNQSDRNTRYLVSGNRVDDGASTGITYRDPAEAVLDATGAGQTIDYVNILGNAIVRSAGTGIIAQSTETFSLYGVTIATNVLRSVQPASGRVIHLLKCSRCSVTGNTITDAGSTADGIRLETSSECVVNGNLIEWGSVPSDENGVQLVDADSNMLASNIVIRATTGIKADNSSNANRLSGNLLIGCTTEDNLGTGANRNELWQPPASYWPPCTFGATAFPTASICLYYRVSGRGTVSKIAMHIGTQSGNVSVGVYRSSGIGRSAVPITRIATSGDIACPAAGYAELSLGGSIDVVEGDWFAISADNTTVTFQRSSSSLFSDIGFGSMYSQTSAHPVPSTPGTLVGRGGPMFTMVGVA